MTHVVEATSAHGPIEGLPQTGPVQKDGSPVASFMTAGVPASSMYLATNPKQTPCTVSLPEMFIVCFGKYSVPDSVRHVGLLSHPEKLLRVPDAETVPALVTESVTGAFRS